MQLVPGICTQCGSNLEVDPSKESAICSFCGTPFITEKVINNYNTTNVTNIGNLHADVVNVSDSSSIDNRIKSAETFIKLGKKGKAEEIYRELTKECPYDYRSWWGLLLLYADNLEGTFFNNWGIGYMDKMYSSAMTVANEQDKKMMETKYLPFISKVKEQYEKTKADYEQRSQDLYAKGEAEVAINEERIEQIMAEKNKIIEIPTWARWVVGIAIFILSSAVYATLFGLILIGIGFIGLKILEKRNEAIEEEINRKLVEEKNRFQDITNRFAREAEPLMEQYKQFTEEYHGVW